MLKLLGNGAGEMAQDDKVIAIYAWQPALQPPAKPGLIVYAYSPSSGEETGVSLWLFGQPSQIGELLVQ